MRRAAPHLLTLTLGLCLALPGCGDDGAPDDAGAPSAPGATTGSGATDAGDAPGSGRERVTEPARPDAVALPDAPELTDDAARSTLTSALSDLAPEEASRETLLYLARLGDRSIADVVRSELLARDGDEYEDPVAAALGLEVLLVLGDESAVGETLDLARWMIDEEEDVEGMAWALEHVKGARAAEADALLVELCESAYDDVTAAAVEVLARRGSKAADAVLPGIAADAERFDAVRGTAVAAMLMTGHERAATSADALLDSDADPSEVIAGFGVPGAEATVPYIERAMAEALKEKNADLEFAEACYALAEIYGGTSGAGKGLALLQGWLEADPSLDCEEATYALWRLGDTGRTDAAARLLAREVAGASRYDPDLAIDLLEEVARRGLARDPRFRDAVDAAAVTPPREGLPGLDLATQRLRAAAAYAYLRSR